MQNNPPDLRQFSQQRRRPRLAMTLAEVMVVVALTSILMGVAISLLVGLRDWDRNMRRQSIQNEQLTRLGELMRTDIRQAIDVSLPSDDAVVIRSPNEKQIRYELTLEGCRRIVALPGGPKPLTDLFAVGPASSWTLERGAPGVRPMFAVTLHRTSPNNVKRAAPLLVHAAVGADLPPAPE